MAGSIIHTFLEDPPLPGGNYPKEHVRASFGLDGASAASVTASFAQTAPSFTWPTSRPQARGGLPVHPDGSFTGDAWVSSIGTDTYQLNVATQDRANASISSITLDVIFEPDDS